MRILSALLLLGLTSAAPVPEQTAPAPTTYETRTDFNLRVKMRDGVELSADITRPAAEGRFPVILARTPYNKASGGKDRVELVRYFAYRGYVFVATGEKTFERRPVETSGDGEDRLRVISGLKSDDRVVVDGALLLRFRQKQNQDQ